MWEADEKRFLEEVRDAIEKASGKRPRGWMAPWMSSSHHTPDLLKEVGFDFLMDWPADDQPLWMKTRSGPMMSVPYPIEINDSPQILVRHHTPEQFRDFIVGQFEELLRQSAKQPLVCGIALHTMIVGQPYRLRMLREALQHIVNHPQKDKVWFTRPSAIYDHCAALPKGTMVPPPRIGRKRAMAVEILEIHHTGVRVDDDAKLLKATQDFYADVLAFNATPAVRPLPAFPAPGSMSAKSARST